MAKGKSGSFELTTSGFAAKISWSETYNTSNNTSVVQIDSLQIKSSSWYSSYYLDGYISINGAKVITFNSALGSHSAYCSSLNTYFKVEACSSSYTNAPWSSSNITHNSDGTKSVPIAIDIKGYTTSGGAGSGWHISGSKNISLTTIPVASAIDSLSCSTSYLDGSITYKYTPKSANYYNMCNVSLNLDGEYVSIRSIQLGKKSTSQQTATITLSSDELTKVYNNLPGSTKGVLRFTFRTYSDSGYSNQVGAAGHKEITLTIPTSIKPSIGSVELNPVDIKTADGTSRNILVQGKNKLQIIPSGCKAGAGSKISSYTFSGPDITTTTKSSSNTSYEFNCGPISKTGSLTYTVKVTDKRGRTATATKTITCYAYDAPSFSSFDVYRCNSSGTADDKGTYVKYSLGVNYASVNSTNKVTVKIYYKTSSTTDWTSASNALTDSTTKSASAIIKNSSGTSITFGTDATYLVKAEIIDNYNGSVDSSTVTTFGASRIFNIRANGTGIAIGKMAESDDLFECKWPAKFDNNLTVGTSTQTTPPTSGIAVHDVRNADITPNSFGDQNVNFYFDQIDSRYMSMLHMKGWNGSNYAAWELAGNAHNSSSDNTLKYRQGVGDTWGDWQTVITNKNINNYVDQGTYLPLDGSKALTGKLTLDTNLYYASGNTAGLDCQNSDIINANGIYFKDASDSAGESINFYRSDGKWDTLYAADGILKFHSNRSTSTALGGGKVYTSYNVRLGTCTLSSSSQVSVDFSSALNNNPVVMLTPLTTSAGVIPGKVTSVSTTGFSAIIGGSAVSTAKFAYLAICTP